MNASATRVAPGSVTASANPPPAVTSCRNSRRLTFVMVARMSGPLSGGRAHCSTDPRVRAAAADIAGHGGVDLTIGCLGSPGDERGGLHNLAALAVAALRYVVLAP